MTKILGHDFQGSRDRVSPEALYCVIEQDTYVIHMFQSHRACVNVDITRKDMALNAISMNSALADKEFVLSLHHKLHVSTCINKPNDVHKHNQSIIHSINQSFLHKQQ